MTKTILAATVGVFLLAGTALASTTQTKTANGGSGTKTTASKGTTHHKHAKRHHTSKKGDMSTKAS